ncbi:MAG: regulatory protein RecX [Candidatus Auribacterota bacterium]|jgi:SOS response regulatory protein OraA/RecX|nr:regulatory protein RecX [Candidatus Auribacterota bacterium]
MDHINAEALNKALKCIMRRDMSRAELHEKLTAQGLNECDAHDIISYLIEKKWYSEEKSARELTEAKIRNSHASPAYITRFLLDKHFDPLVIEQTVGSLFSHDSEKQLALVNAQKKISALQKKYSNDSAKTNKIRTALQRFLAQRGFSEPICEDVVNTLLTEE